MRIIIGKDYSGAKFFYTEPISLNKAHLAFDNKTLHLYNYSHYNYNDWILIANMTNFLIKLMDV